MVTKRKAAMPLQQEEEETMDPHYKRFLDHLRVDGKSYIFKMNEKLSGPNDASCSDGEKKKKKEEEVESLRSEPSINKCYRTYLEYFISRDGSEDVLKRDHDGSCSRSRRDLQPCHGGGDGSFGDRLRRCLDEPFNQEEYGQLMEEAALRRPMSRCKELRLRSASFRTPELGLSYLDRYSDLREQIECADPHKRLTLLRGFFFWLKNLSHKGAFIPWKKPAFRNGTRPFVNHDMT